MRIFIVMGLVMRKMIGRKGVRLINNRTHGPWHTVILIMLINTQRNHFRY